jgi:hypothetical protein
LGRIVVPGQLEQKSEAPTQPIKPDFFFCEGFFFRDRVSQSICPGLALTYHLPDLCLLSSWNYRREPPAPGHSTFYGIVSPVA